MAGEGGENGGRERPISLTERPHTSFHFIRRPQETPRALGLGWDRRIHFWPNPALNGLLGARLGKFRPPGTEKVVLGADDFLKQLGHDRAAFKNDDEHWLQPEKTYEYGLKN